ncbi:MAG TPA: universal stress protein [Alphaproteobacteria bacterium]|nr:universal stress protein [Alphaproteobacteria bacterium]
MKVLVAIDGSRYGWKAIDYLGKQKTLFGAAERITVVHVDDGYADRVMRAARTRLRRARLQCEEVVLHGKAAAEIASYARNGEYDLIVMGSHGYGAIERLLLGSVVAKVLALCKTPVLLIR